MRISHRTSNICWSLKLLLLFRAFCEQRQSDLCRTWHILIRALARHLIFLINPTNPLLVFSPSAQPDTPIPLLIPLTLLAILIHLDLGLLLYPSQSTLTITPFSYLPLCCLSAVSPCMSILLGRNWLTVAWWSVTGGVVWLAHSVQCWIDKGDRSIMELEGMKYVAPGA
jgi:hypothetical protein